ncbi:YfmQ family protein [Alicyclobacillus tolerans]|uniref:YfmQ family protein n=1 Tax=Alicyclobacillus tolerans TaxID=90970 RepID=UPI00235145C4|nr:YfmQ family protein [Alicyclobacillus tolerans]MCF8565488.1 YfmQ family protein [Alicyclobacillus tolerans]
MPPIPHWFVLVCAVCLPMLSFFLSPPTVWVDKFVESLAIHPKLSNPEITSINVYGKELLGRERDRFILAFNNANFLYRYGMVPVLNQNPIMVKVKQGKKTYEFKMYLYGNHMIEIIRYKKKKRIPYRVSSQVLEEILELRMRDQWWMKDQWWIEF